MTEQWRPVLGFETGYEVSDRGRVRSLGFTVPARGGHTAYRKGRVLKQAVKSNGYLQVTLCDAGRRIDKGVHVIVCEAFKGPRPGDQQVCHWDGIRSNNCEDNLRWGSAGDNAADRARHGNFVCNLPSLEGYVF